MILDVGYGIKPRGDVNTDIAYQTYDVSRAPIDYECIKNFVRCDGQYLPFRSKTFCKVCCYHVIEHVKDLILLIGELMRIS